jgi:hypothetical protein
VPAVSAPLKHVYLLPDGASRLAMSFAFNKKES